MAAISISCVQSTFWGAWDPRRIWAPRHYLACLSKETSVNLWLVYRVLIALYALSVSIVDRTMVSYGSNKYTAYLTIQGVWLTVCYLLCSMLCFLLVYQWPELYAELLPPGSEAVEQQRAGWDRQRRALHLLWVGLVRATQLLFCIALPFQVVIVSLYWSLLAQTQSFPTAVGYWDNLECHGIKLVLLALDLGVSAMRLPDAHAAVTAGATVLYLIENAAITLTSEPIYFVLTWRDSGTVVLVIGVCVAVLAVFFLVSGVAFWRDRLVAAGHRPITSVPRVGGSRDALDQLFPEHFLDEEPSVYTGPCACCWARGATGKVHATSGDGEAGVGGGEKTVQPPGPELGQSKV